MLKADEFDKLIVRTGSDTTDEQIELFDTFECPNCHTIVLDIEGHIEWHRKVNKRIAQASLGL